MKKFYCELLTALLLAGCGSPDTGKDDTPGAEKSGDDANGQTAAAPLRIDASGHEAYQNSLSAIRKSLRDDRQLYEFVAAVRLLLTGSPDSRTFLHQVDGMTSDEVIKLGREKAFDCLSANFRRNRMPAELRSDIMSRSGISELPPLPRGTVPTVNATTPELRDRTLCAMVCSADDNAIYDLTAALDVILAMSLDEADYNRMLNGHSAAEMIAWARANAFEAAYKKSEFSAPAHLLRGEVDETPEPPDTPKIDTTDQYKQAASMGRAIRTLDDQQLYEFMTAVELVRTASDNAEDFNAKLNGRTARGLINEQYKQNPGDFIQLFGAVRQEYPPEKLTSVRAGLVAYSVLTDEEAKTQKK